MARGGYFLRFLERAFVVRFFFTLLLASLLLLADGFVLVYLSRLYGVFLILAIEATTGFIGAILVIDTIARQLRLLEKKVQAGNFPRREYAIIAASLVAGVLLILPGFVTDVVGLLFYVPGLRYLTGMAVTAGMKERLREAYEYSRLKY